jgi:hypothetical protein
LVPENDATIYKFFFFLIGQVSFPKKAWVIEYAPIHLSLEEVAVRTGHKVLMEVDFLVIHHGL